ncbi:MAG: NAD(P)-dependent alcohol dehydrogenase [Planctomycetota bacterium]|nr:NAD(P)-dependent alcohol dehydrogenase [Planctomycetota bacterium]
MTKTFASKAFGAASPTAKLAPLSIQRREPGPSDVHIEILFCGVCHSDLHQVRDEWKSVMPTAYPCVPGHEIVGRVKRVGSDVKKFKVGDIAGVGCMVDSCRTCPQCKSGEEQYCASMPTFTYNFPDKHVGGVTYGGYSDAIVVDEAFVVKVPAGIDPARAAPLLCAGITTYSPLRTWKVGPGHKVGVVGLGGLGHMAVKLARAMGAHVVVFTTSERKRADALKLGAHEVILSTDPQAMQSQLGTFDFILDTVSAPHDLNAYLEQLKLDGSMVLVGAPAEPVPLGVFSLIFKRRRLAGSAIGGIKETQEMLDFCAKHGLAADIELIPAVKLDEAYARMVKGDVKYRFVIDIASMK